MKFIVIICRSLLGLAFVVFGLNILWPFLPMPPFPEGSLEAKFMGVMVASSWMTLVGVIQLLGGLLVLIGRTAPLGLAFLAPVLVNILAFHTFLAHGEGIALGLFLSALEIYLIYYYRNYFRPLFSTNATPSAR